MDSHENEDEKVRKNEDGSFTMCCGRRKCPSILFAEDGSGTVRGDHGEEIPFTADQLMALSDLIRSR